MNCRSVPFWSWNGDLDVEETRWQVREMTEKGMGGGFMHSRPGLATEYLGDDWFANCAAVIEEGRKAEFSAWLYDEDRWPSGSCGGATAEANPDFRIRVLVMQRGNEPVPRTDTAMEENAPNASERPLARFRVIQQPGQEPEFAPLNQEENGADCLSFYEAVSPPSGWRNDGFTADLLNRGAVAEFIRNTYDVYADRFRQNFGKEIPGIFTDEPTLQHAYPWSVHFHDEFLKRRGYDLIAQLPHLFYRTPDADRIRHDYWKTVRELFNENYMAQIGTWCREHGIAFTGHLNCEHNLAWQIYSNGGVMAHYVHMGIPGIDILTESIAEVLTCKQTSSICNQFNKPLMLSELYGCAGYNFSFEGQKWIGDWQMALGVNFLCPHLTWYTMKGCAKRDYPPSYFYQSPWWRHYRHVADYQARLSYVLRQGRPVRDILLLHPLTGAWCKFDPTMSREDDFGLREEDAQFKQIMDNLLGLHRDFDLGDEAIMAGHARVDGEEMVVGDARYKLVIVPPTCNLEQETAGLLEEYVRAGGKLIFVGESAALVDGEPSDRVRQLAQSQGVHRAGVGAEDLEDVIAAILPKRVSVLHADTHREAKKVLCQQRQVDDGYVFFLANTDRDAGVPLRVCVPTPGACQQWDCETGEVRDLASDAAEDGSHVELTLAPVGSAVLHLNPNRLSRTPTETPPASVGKTPAGPRDGWRFCRLAPNSLVLDRCRYRINDDEFSEEAFLNDAQEDWRKRFGLFSVLSMNRDTQPWKRLQDPDNLRPLARLALKYSFQVETVPEKETYLVLEDRDELEIVVNFALVDAPASGWFMDKSFEKVPIGEFLKRGSNMVELRTTLTAMRVIEDIYVTGDFGVAPETFAITSEPERLSTGDWCPQGYPFYTDGMVYETRIEVKEGFRGRVAVELERFEGTVAAVWVNGKKAAVIGWRPYRADVTDFVRPGSNDLGIEIVGSPRNLMGPRHSTERYPVYTSSRELLETGEPGYHITPAGLMGDVTVVYSRSSVDTLNRGR